MRRKIMIMAGLVGLLPAAAIAFAPASGPIIKDRPPLPDLPLRVPAAAGTSWTAPAAMAGEAPRFDTRDYRRAPVASPAPEPRSAGRGGPLEPLSDYGSDDMVGGVRRAYNGVDEYPYAFDDRFSPEQRDADYPERVERYGDRDGGYDRNYPYERPYRGGSNAGGNGYAPGGYIVTETVTTTTKPSTVSDGRYDDAEPAPRRYVAPRRRGKLVRRAR